MLSLTKDVCGQLLFFGRRRSVANVQVTYEQVMLQLAEEHSEIRLSAFQICNELFERSHAFRELLVSDFHEFIKLVTGTELDCSLPPPKPAAAQLKEKSLFAIKSWREKFGEGYPKLVLGYNHLKLNKKASRNAERHVLCSSLDLLTACSNPGRL